MAAIDLTQAIRIRDTHLDTVHRFSAYFQVAAAVTVGYAWEMADTWIHLPYLVACIFILFSLINFQLLQSSQNAAFKAHNTIGAYLNSIAQVNTTIAKTRGPFDELPLLDSPLTPLRAGVNYWATTMAVVVLILSRVLWHT